MEPFIQRVIDEKNDLDDKKSKLSAFFENTNFIKVDKTQQRLLLAQHGAMQAYSDILRARIELLTETI